MSTTLSTTLTRPRTVAVSYDPIVDLVAGTVIAVEVRRATREPVPAADVLATGADALGERRSAADLGLVLGLGRGDLCEPGLAEHLLAALDGAPPEAVLLQMPTAVAAGSLARTSTLLAQLRAAGFAVALSGFEVGGTLELLRRLEVDGLGLGAGLVRLLGQDRQAESNALAVASAAGDLPVTAAGVRGRDIVRRLRSMGVHRIQGPGALAALVALDESASTRG